MFHKNLNVSMLYSFRWAIKAVGDQQNILLAFRRRGEETEGIGWVPEWRILRNFQDDGFGAVRGVNGGGLYGLGLRFGSVTGFGKPAPSPKPAQVQ